MSRVLACVALLAMPACGDPSRPPSHPPAPATTGPSTPPPPLATQARAPGLCGAWATTPLDLDALGRPGDGNRLRARADARGGFTVIDAAPDGTVTVLALTSRGAAAAAPLVFAPGGPVLDDAVATTTGWLEAFSSASGAHLDVVDPSGALVSTAHFDAQDAGGAPTLAVGSSMDGTLFAREDLHDGVGMPSSRVGFFDAAAGEVHVLLDVPLDVGADPNTATAFGDGWFYGVALGGALRTVDAAGDAHDIPAATSALTGATLVAGAGGRTATAVLAPASPGAHALVTFLGDAAPDATYALDVEVDRIAGAPRDPSGGVVLVWTTDGLTASGGVAYGFTELSPTGARGEIHPLGNEVVAARSVVVARAGDRTSYLAIAENVGVREALLLTCVDGG